MNANGATIAQPRIVCRQPRRRQWQRRQRPLFMRRTHKWEGDPRRMGGRFGPTTEQSENTLLPNVYVRWCVSVCVWRTEHVTPILGGKHTHPQIILPILWYVLIRLHTQTGVHEPDMGWSLVFIFVNGNLVAFTFTRNKQHVGERLHGNMLLNEWTHSQHVCTWLFSHINPLEWLREWTPFDCSA